MIAYKFLAEGAVGPFTRFRWPRPAGGSPGAWIEAPPGAPDDRWIHACRVADLPYWLGDELWRVELQEPTVDALHQVASPRGRLVERVSGWTRALAIEFAAECARRARDLAVSRAPPRARAALLGANDVAALAAVSEPLQAEFGEPAAYVYTAAANAAGGAPAVCAFVLEMFARSLGGDRAGDEERARQSRWLAERLGLEA